MKPFIALTILLTSLTTYAGPEVHNQVSGQLTQQKLLKIVESTERPEDQRLRDQYRHPFETLSFFGIEPSMTVVEIWPGGQGGFYHRILSPLLQESGRYIAVESGDDFPTTIEPAQPNDADMVLVFRAHGFMIYDHPAQDYFHALYKMLKPGGIFGIVDHRGDENFPQDPKGENGYVNQSHVLNLARNAGFELIASSEINANPMDSKDHPEGLYSLPPTLRGTTFNRSARKKFLKIGESDRMTLKFRKPPK